jgi:hypothetical protein
VAAPARAAAPPAVALAAVVAAPADVRAVAGGVAAALRRRAGARTAVVCLPGDERSDRSNVRHRGVAPAADAAYGPLPGGQHAQPVAWPAARRLARRLAARDLGATATGALCHVALPGADEEAIRAAWRVVAAAGDAPVVVGVTTRSDDLDAFLAQADRLVLATAADAVYAELALDSLAHLGPPTDRVRPPAGFVARRAAALGLLELRAPMGEAVA